MTGKQINAWRWLKKGTYSADCLYQKYKYEQKGKE
jgi:hypothetical protein